MRPPDTPDTREGDLALRIFVSSEYAEAVGAILMDSLGPFAQEEGETTTTILVFYPDTGTALSDADILAPLGGDLKAASSARIERQVVPRDWVDGWKDHFHPVVIGAVRVRPPWEPALGEPDGERTRRGRRPRRRIRGRKVSAEKSSLVDVVINPGTGFGTGLHPTTRGTLQLLLEGTGVVEREGGPPPGPLADVGTGSGILAIVAAKLGWAPVIAFDIDPAAVVSARENIAANGVAHRVQVWESGVEEAEAAWFEDATVLANMTLEPVLKLLQRLTPAVASSAGGGVGSGTTRLRGPRRLVVSGILAGAQEDRVVFTARTRGFFPGGRLYQAEWVSMELFPFGPETPTSTGES